MPTFAKCLDKVGDKARVVLDPERVAVRDDIGLNFKIYILVVLKFLKTSEELLLHVDDLLCIFRHYISSAPVLSSKAHIVAFFTEAPLPLFFFFLH